jgi:hypothetical protein
MPFIREWLRRLWGTFRKAPEDAVMEEELRLHLDMLAADLQRRGLTPEEALRQARLQAGGVAQVMDQRRDQRVCPGSRICYRTRASARECSGARPWSPPWRSSR